MFSRAIPNLQWGLPQLRLLFPIVFLTLSLPQSLTTLNHFQSNTSTLYFKLLIGLREF